jgi:hypothetical protein
MEGDRAHSDALNAIEAEVEFGRSFADARW